MLHCRKGLRPKADFRQTGSLNQNLNSDESEVKIKMTQCNIDVNQCEIQRSWVCNDAQISSLWHKAACIQPLPLQTKLPWLMAAALVRLLFPERAKGHKGAWMRHRRERHLLWKITGSQKKTALLDQTQPLGRGPT